MSNTHLPELSHKLRADFQARQKMTKTAADKGTPTDPDNKGTVEVPSDAEARKKLQLDANANNTDGGTSSTGVEGEQVGDPLPAGGEPARVGTPDMPVGEGVKSATIAKVTGSLAQLRTKLAAVTSATPDLTKAAAAVEKPAPAAAAAPEIPAGGEALMVKIASALMNTEQGRAAVEIMLQEQLGVEAADGLVKQAAFAAQQQRLEQEQARELFIKQAAAIEQNHQELRTQLSNLPPEVQESVIKVASAIEQKMLLLPNDVRYYELFKKGAADAAQMMAMAGGAESPMGALPPEAGLAGAMPPGATGELSPEELAMLIQQLADDGQIPPEVAAQLLAELQGASQEQVKMAYVKELQADAVLKEVLPDMASVFTGLV